MSRKIILPFFVFFIFTTLLPAGKIPLKKAVETGIQKDSQYKNRLLDSKITRLDQQKARMKRLFNLDFSGSYLFKSQQMEISFPSSMPGAG